MYCPKCRAEYREGFTQCSDCGVALVEALPAADRHAGPQLVTAFESNDYMIDLAKGLLEDAGIDFWIEGESQETAARLVLGPVRFPSRRILVPRECEGDAAAALAPLTAPIEEENG